MKHLSTPAGRRRALGRRGWILGAAATITVAAASIVIIAPAEAEPIPVPAADPFYDAPSNLAELGNGTIIHSREIAPYGLPVPLPITTWQVQYKSTDAQGAPTTGMATLVVPTAPWTGPGARPLVSYQLAEDSLSTRCATSYSLRAGFAPGGPGPDNTNTEAPVAAALLQRNWAVVMSDYQGPQSRFLDSRQSGHSVLDGIRAALAFGPAGLAPDSPLGLMGYSGGSLASIWAGQQEPDYAPELRLTGLAVGGLPANLAHALQVTSGTYTAGLGMLALAAFSRVAPEADIPSLLNDRGRTMIAENNQSCGTEFITKYAFTNLDDYTLAPDIGADPRIVALAEQNRLDAASPAGPTYVWHSTGDDVLPIADTDQVVRNWCGQGATITYVRTNIPTHLGAAYPGIPAAIDYLDQRFGGNPAPAGCS
ncbi:lipase family protein [Nocardia sp. NBC_01388]|uniref:lipase family protein n=1 Tax=Nocardia sp. NBC_01388 TaxID=2903596 RepID=UPI00324C5B14